MLHYYVNESSNDGLFQKLGVVVASNASAEVQGSGVGRQSVGWLAGWLVGKPKVSTMELGHHMDE